MPSPELTLNINSGNWEITVQRNEIGEWIVIDGCENDSDENGILRALDDDEVAQAQEMIQGFEDRLDARWELKQLANKGK